MKPKFAEFFAGGGMVRQALFKDWQCSFANDFDQSKAKIYKANWGEEELLVSDVNKMKFQRSLNDCDLFWASSPCQDLSYAGKLAGLAGEKSSAFWGFWNQLMLAKFSNSHPKVVVIENVRGLVTANEGSDFSTIFRIFTDAGYKIGALEINASEFVPQSRPRVFIIAVRKDLTIPDEITLPKPDERRTSKALREFTNTLDGNSIKKWINWFLPVGPTRRVGLNEILDQPQESLWHTAQQSERIFELMNPLHRSKIVGMEGLLGTIYKRTRLVDGVRKQSAEIRTDGLAGCLRTPGGGSSKQILAFKLNNEFKTRFVSIKEAARLMGLPEDYKIPSNYNEGLHFLGDGVVVPVVQYLSDKLFLPIIGVNKQSKAA